MWKKVGSFMLMTTLILLVNGCGNAPDNGSSNTKGKEATGSINQPSNEPVTLKLALNIGFSDDYLNRFYIEPLKKKYPNITIQVMKDKIDNLILAGDTPDVVIVSTTGVQKFMQLGYGADMNPLVKKNGDNIDRFDPVTIDSLKIFSDKGELVGMPVLMNFAALFYNKDIFDKFGVPYPKDGMTWDEAIALGKRLTRTEEGIRYRGLNPGGADLMGYGLALPYADPKTNKGLLETDSWKTVVGKAAEIYSQPGWLEGKLPDGQGQNDFLKLKDTAMLGAWTILGSLEEMQQGINWDMVTLPNFKEKQGNSREVDFHILMVSKTSKHQDQAYQLISSLTSPEVQELINKSGSLPVIKKTEEHKKTFGSDMTSIKGKNINAVFGVKANSLHSPYTPYDGEARKQIVSAAYEAGSGNTDVNSALRSAQEKTNKYIETELLKNK
jgi:multiple sugar transport system substrate-binding protein